MAVNEPPTKIIPWMTDDVCARLKYKRNTDEDFKKRSRRNWQNKEEGPTAKIDYSQGSVLSTMWAMKFITDSDLIMCLCYY